LHVVQISFFVDPQRRPPAALLREWRSLVDVAAAAASVGARVTVVQASMVPGEIVQSGVAFHFVAPPVTGAPLASASAFRALMRELTPDVFHVHGLGFAGDVLELRALAPNVPILLQDHADRVPSFWRRAIWRRGAAAAGGISFCARAQAEPFCRARLLTPGIGIFEIPESTSKFVPGDAIAARAATGIHGAPALLWVGHLNANKDPLTVLEGVSAAAREMPGLRLWCCYASAPLLSAVEARIAGDPLLRERVHLLGRMPHERVERLMQAADLFVLGSRREGCSYALLEAMATGLTPIVTDIPPSRALIGNESVGALWRCGDPQSLCSALRRGAAELATRPRARVRAHFDQELSSAALGRKWSAAYHSVVEQRSHAAASVVTP
jgi:glycosyltransferase involved in cell wall biosynthesis